MATFDVTVSFEGQQTEVALEEAPAFEAVVDGDRVQPGGFGRLFGQDFGE